MNTIPSTDQSSLQQTTVDPGLEALFARLEHQSLAPDFHMQRELALSFALRPYLNHSQPYHLIPLSEEVELAALYLYSDYFPTDSHPTLIEQVRDLITEHVPQEEREWLDAVRHSYMDLFEITKIDQKTEATILTLRSLGDGKEFEVTETILSPTIQEGHILLTRLIRRPDCLSLPGVAVTLSGNMGRALFTLTDEKRREIEVRSGQLALGEWPEFTKQYGYLFLWNLVQIRSGALWLADSQMQYHDSNGKPYLYAIAMYEHREPKTLEEGLDTLQGFQRLSQTRVPGQDPEKTNSSLIIWAESNPDSHLDVGVSRVTLTPTQLFLETNSTEHLDALKHKLARTFGFSLHFRGEITTPPTHIPPDIDLLSETFKADPVTVTREDDLKILKPFLESVYIDWAERSCPSLHDDTPRHICSRDGNTNQVATLIDQMEQYDLGYRRTGMRGYDYKILRGHVGL